MYNKVLDTFKAAADCGSFTKAAEKLFISHTAVIKQINALEKTIGTALFERDRRGVTLTAAGKCLYKELPKFLRSSESLVRKVREAGESAPKIIRVGTSAMYPCHAFMALWELMSQRCPQFQLKIMPIENDERRTEFLDTAYDFLVSPYDQGFAQAHTFLQVGTYHFCVAMPRSHPLAKKTQASLQDLEGGPLLVMRPGNSEINDQIRRDIQEKHSSIAIIDIAPHYSLQTFNQCMESGIPLLSLECWKDVHPGLATVPLAEDYTLPYGVVAARQPTENVVSFFAKLQEFLRQK